MNIRESIFKLRLTLYRFLPIKRNRIVFLSHLGKTFGCNPRYLCEYLAVNYPGKFDLVWIYDRDASEEPVIPTGVRSVPFFSHKCLREIATSRYIISNTRISDAFYFRKRKGQIYLQTWHSSLRLKCIEGDARLGEKYEEFAKRDSQKIDVIFSGSRFSTNIFKSSFWYDGEVIESGTPRIDWLNNVKDSEVDAIYQRSGLSKEYRYLLYAPTFRKGDSIEAYLTDFSEICLSLNRRFGGEWKILYRLHPNLKGRISMGKLQESVIDMTDYDDIQELLVMSDLLVTDYSSCMFDAALCKKNCILYTPDLDEYVAKERKLYFDIKSLPFPMARNKEELIAAIESFSDCDYQERLANFMGNIGSCETGDACKNIAEYIIDRL